jgi:hypothetical protein
LRILRCKYYYVLTIQQYQEIEKELIVGSKESLYIPNKWAEIIINKRMSEMVGEVKELKDAELFEKELKNLLK